MNIGIGLLGMLVLAIVIVWFIRKLRGK